MQKIKRSSSGWNAVAFCHPVLRCSVVPLYPHLQQASVHHHGAARTEPSQAVAQMLSKCQPSGTSLGSTLSAIPTRLQVTLQLFLLLTCPSLVCFMDSTRHFEGLGRRLPCLASQARIWRLHCWTSCPYLWSAFSSHLIFCLKWGPLCNWASRFLGP